MGMEFDPAKLIKKIIFFFWYATLIAAIGYSLLSQKAKIPYDHILYLNLVTLNLFSGMLILGTLIFEQIYFNRLIFFLFAIILTLSIFFILMQQPGKPTAGQFTKTNEIFNDSERAHKCRKQLSRGA